MKKHLYLWLSLFLGILGLFIVIVGSNKISKNNNMYEGNDITMTIKDGTLTKSSAMIVITDISGDNNSYGLWFRIDKKVKNDKWEELKVEDQWINTPAYHVDENNILELECDWKNIYGDLDKGEYRLVKEVNNKYIVVEFAID